MTIHNAPIDGQCRRGAAGARVKAGRSIPFGQCTVTRLFLAIGLGTGVCLGAEAPQFEASATVILEGPIRTVDWSGPSLQFTMGSYDGHGGQPEWTVMGPPPSELKRLGWTSADLQPGAVLDVVVRPDHLGSRVGQLVRIILRDSSTLEITAHGTTHLIPPEAFAPAWKGTANDPLAGYYGNTVVFQGKGYEGRAWFNADNTVQMFSRDRQPDGNWATRSVEGIYWLQKLQDKYIKCFFFPASPIGPFCHSPVNFERPGDHWEIRMPNGDPETREIIVGHH